MKCIYCNSEVELTSSDIITYAITGAKLTKSFVCKTHNAFTNDNYEKKYVADLDFFRNHLGLTTRDGKPIQYKADISIDGTEMHNVKISNRASLYAPKDVVAGVDDNGHKILMAPMERINKISKGKATAVDISDVTLHKTITADSFLGFYAVHSVAKMAYEWYCYINNIEEYKTEYKDIVDYILGNTDGDFVDIILERNYYFAIDQLSEVGTNAFFQYDDIEADLQALVDVMEYATNKDKTEKRFFVTGVNCDTATARDEMMIAKAEWNDESEIVCYHGFQSFKHGEVTPEVAHEVGVKLAEKMWGDRFQVIVATHLNTECLHNHFVVNSVSFLDGKHYHDNKANLRLLRQRSDELCREYALSVIEHPSGKKKPYALYQAEKNGMPTRDNVARQAVDEAISKSFTLKDFDRQMAEMGYRVSFDPNRKYWTIIGKGWERPKRLYKLGEDYTNERITERIRENSYAVKFSRFAEPQKTVQVFRVKGSLKNAKKIGGLRGLYLHYCYRLGILPKSRKQNYARLHYLLKDDLMKMEAISQETRLLCRNRIDTVEQLLL